MFGERIKLEIEKLIEEKTHIEKHRKYLGISQIGKPCPRALWYQFRFFLPEQKITAREKRLFNRGHREEPILLADLQEVGVKVVSTQNEITACSGHIKGHLDAILKNISPNQKELFLGEFKTSATKYFNSLVSSQSVKKSFKSHFDQSQGYMYLMNISHCLYICVNKEDDRRYYEFIELDIDYAKGLFDRAESIIFATSPPDRIGTSDYYLCGPKWCKFRNICHFNETHNHTCRNCLDVELHDKARWKCKKKNKFLSFKKQKICCKHWKPI